jgi:hypothetical protein
MLNKLLVLAFALLMTASTALAQESALRDDHPDQYTVQAGDTLWGIAERFLNTPWMWPEIWHANPQISNPHLIYPGDQISLVYIDGEPRLTVNRGTGGTVKLSPKVREVSAGQPIPTIDLSDLDEFLVHARLLTKEELDALPYVVAFENQKPRGVAGDRAYVRNLNGASERQRLAIARPGLRFRDVPANMAQPFQPGREITMSPVQQHSGMYMSDVANALWENVIHHSYFGDSEVIGYEVIELGEAILEATGDPASMRISFASRELREGDVLLPVDDRDFNAQFDLGIPQRVPENARILAHRSAANIGGNRQVVAINMGQRHGLRQGHVLNIMRPGETIRDEVRYPREAMRLPRMNDDEPARSVTLPDEYVGQLLVFRTFDRVSYGIIVRSVQPAKVLDRLTAPDYLD